MAPAPTNHACTAGGPERGGLRCAALAGYEAGEERIPDDIPVRADVKDFGAKGDGEADDADAIEAAANSIEEQGALYFPPGEGVQEGVRCAPTGRWQLPCSFTAPAASRFGSAITPCPDPMPILLRATHWPCARINATRRHPPSHPHRRHTQAPTESPASCTFAAQWSCGALAVTPPLSSCPRACPRCAHAARAWLSCAPTQALQQLSSWLGSQQNQLLVHDPT
jgi:hypothetical protein